MNKIIKNSIALALMSAAAVASAQSTGNVKPCPTGMTLSYSTVTGTPKCIGTPIGSTYGDWANMPASTYAEYAAKMAAAKNNPLSEWLGGGEPPLTESQWNTQNARAANDAARGVTFGASSGHALVPSNTSAQNYVGNQVGVAPSGSNQQGFISDAAQGVKYNMGATSGFFTTDPKVNEGSNRGAGSTFNHWTDMPASTYADYLAKMAASKNDPLSAWLTSGAAPMTEAQWNAQNARVASDAARGVVFGGGGPGTIAAAQAQMAPQAPTPSAVGSFCAPWGNRVTWDSTGAQTDTGNPC